MKSDKPTDSRLILRYRIAFLVLITVGLCLSADLTRLHVKVHTDPEYHSYCAISEWANCESVAASDFAVFFNLPVAVWGLLVFLTMGTLTIWGLRRPISPRSWPFGILFWLCIVANIGSIILYLISHFLIESVCLVCMGVYLTNFLLLLCSFIELRRLRINPFSALLEEILTLASRWVPLTIISTILVLTIIILWSTVPPYWQIENHRPSESLPNGVTEEGHPWIGAKNPKIIIVEYSDYQCPYCRRGHDDMRRLISEHPDKIRLIHRHYPLDHTCNHMLKRPFHPFACTYARMAFCAQQQDRFWEANNYLFVNGKSKTPVLNSRVASSVGLDIKDFKKCMRSQESRDAIQEDLESGRKLGIRGTPTFVIDNRIYPGRVPNEVLDPILGTEKTQGSRVQ